MPAPFSAASEARIVAVLGPTNTGKTHLAIERMLAHGSGVIGLPLRLLAREVYDKVVKAKGHRAAALITGEEKIAPEGARFFICTVEAMPLDRRAEFLAVDEIQLAGDPDRGHVFTDRLLRARGTGETMLMGSDTMRPLLRRLLPQAEVQRRERLSTLSYAGPRKLTKLPRRSAIVAFSAEEVYAIAELIRRHRGGAAVVMGALSPRTRNAQVELYQSGEVDFLVATDAIGMGLNMDVDHVAFASRVKFDGRRTRLLRADEVAQIAGRAGRFRTDGSFGETGECPAFDPETVARVQAHEFEPLTAVEWRSAELDFSSVPDLAASLERPPGEPGLVRVRGAIDERALRHVSQEPEIAHLARRPEDVRRLWEACQTPDFRKASVDEHCRLVSGIARGLLGPRQRLSQDWIAKEVSELDRADGDLGALQTRLAHIRTWTYVANRPDWLDDCEHWRARARAVEDRLSDALHALLTQRFIDRRTSTLLRSLRRDDVLLAEVNADGEVSVEGHHVGRLDGLTFRTDPLAGAREAQALRSAAVRALRPEVDRRLAALRQGKLRLREDGKIMWRGVAVARLVPGGRLLAPRIAMIGGEIGDPQRLAAARSAVESWVSAEAARRLAPLARIEAALDARALSPASRGLAFMLLEAAGVLDRAKHADALAALSGEDRRDLRRLGVRFGRAAIYLAGMGAPARARLHALLRFAPTGQAAPPAFSGEPAIPRDAAQPDAAYAAGFRLTAGAWAVRVDALEAFLEGCARAASENGTFAVTPEMAALLGQGEAEAHAILAALGYRRVKAPSGELRWRAWPRKRRDGHAQPQPSGGAFAELADLVAGRRRDARDPSA